MGSAPAAKLLVSVSFSGAPLPGTIDTAAADPCKPRTRRDRERGNGGGGGATDTGDSLSWSIPEGRFLRQFLFFNPNEDNDIAILSQVCNLLLQYVKRSGDIVTLFAAVNYSLVEPLVAHRVKKLGFICVQSVHQKRHDWDTQLLMLSESTTMPSVPLLKTMACLFSPNLPWNCDIVGYLQWKKIYRLFLGIIISVLQNARNLDRLDNTSALEQVLMIVSSHVGHHPCRCPLVDPRWSFSFQLLSIPFLWHRLPHFKKFSSAEGLSKYYIHQMTCSSK